MSDHMTGEAGVTRIALAPVVDTDAITGHLAAMRDAVASGGAIEITCDAVEQIGLAGLQLLASARRTCAERGLALSFNRPSERLVATARLAGMQSILFPANGSAS